VRRALPEEKIVSWQDAVSAVLRNAGVDFTQRNVLMCHQFITGCEVCDSEELSVGTLDHIDGAVFDGFDYVALGHIHKPQKVLRDTIRYAGSPLKYSFSEAAHRKSVTIVDVLEKGDGQVRREPLYPLHDVRLVEGTLDV
jgi:exonuclease SbcD